MQRAAGTIRELLNRAETHLTTHGVPNARRNAEWMLCASLGVTMLDLYVRSREHLGPGAVSDYWTRIERRASREPLQYILGTTEFMALPFLARPGVFVPRPDTEVLVEHAEKKLRALALHEPALVLDLCCGSGVIGVSIAKHVPNAGVTAVDTSDAAVELTADNAALNGVSDRVRRCTMTPSTIWAVPRTGSRPSCAIRPTSRPAIWPACPAKFASTNPCWPWTAVPTASTSTVAQSRG